MKYLRPLRWQFTGGLLAGVVYSVASGFGLPLMAKTALPVIFQDEEKMAEVPAWFLGLVETIFGGDVKMLLLASCLAIPAVFSIRAVAGYINGVCMNIVGVRSVESLRKDIFDRLLYLPLGFFGKHKSGDLLARTMGDTELLRQILTHISADVVKQPLTLISAVGYLVWESTRNESFMFALIGAASIPICVIPVRMAGKRLKKRSMLLQDETGLLSATVSETLQSPLEVRAYNMQKQQWGVFSGHLDALVAHTMKIVKYRLMITPTIDIVAALGFSLTLWMGANAGMKFEEFFALGLALFLSYEPVKRIGAVHSALQQVQAAVRRTSEVVDATDDIPDAENPRRPDEALGVVEFRDVGFRYDEDEVLKDVNVTLKPGEMVALVGPSGAGKTTMANLIPRFYDVSAGAVLLDGVDVREWSKFDLREQMAIVPQSPVLFHGTVRENIALGCPGATQGEVESAAKAAYAHEFIAKLEDGYETLVGERGTNFSGGQRQRLALARALIKGAPVLILDEATSALDSESETHVQSAIEETKEGRTTIVIAHRLTSIVNADRVLVFQGGLVVGDGRHDELMESNALYQSLYSSYAGGVQESDD